ncbi:putative ribonuclease H-like domain-containing protein [Tanacetum coccineum]
MSFDDLYNNFKIVKQEVKKTGTSSLNSSSQNMAFVSTPSCTNDVKTANVQVSTASSSVSTDSTQDSTANLSDAIVYAFLANQPNGSQLVYEDLEQIHKDDREEMDLMWQLALLSMRARRYYQRIGKKITINGSDTKGYDKFKVECFNCHKMGHFARECRNPRNQESRPRNHDNRNTNQDSSRRTVNVEETSSKAMVAIDGAGFDWSFMAEEEVTTNMALVAFLDSEVYNDKTCSNTYLKSFETIKTQLDNLRVEFNKSEFNLATYKRGLASVEEQLIEKLKKEKESNQIEIDKFENASKCLEKLIGSQISDNSRKSMGCNAVPPPPTDLFTPPTIDLSNTGLEEFQQPEFQGYGPKASKSVCVDTSNKVKTTPATPLVEELVSEKEKQTVFPTKIEFVKQQDKTTRKPVKTVNTAHPKSIVFSAKPILCFSKSAQSTVKRPYQSKTVLTNKRFTQKVNSAKAKAVNTARPKAVNTARPHSAVVNAVRANQANADSPPADDQGYDMLPLVEESKEERSLIKMCDKKNCVLFMTTRMLILSHDFKLPEYSQILLKNSRKPTTCTMFDIKNIVPKESLTCLVAKARLDESILWHRRLGHVNFKTINKLVKDNLVRGLTFMSSLMNKKYCLMVTDDYSRFTWVFFLASKDETSGILKNFITKIENLVDKKVKITRRDNGTEFKNRIMNEFYEKKGIKREYGIARTPQQNGVAERRNRTLIELARTMVIIVKPHNKTPYELFRGRTPALSFMRPFRCYVSILNTLDHLGKFDGKSVDGFFVGYSLTSKAFRVYNIRTRRVEENLHIRFLEDKHTVLGDGSEVSIGEGSTSKETDINQDYIVMPLWKDSSLFDSPSMNVSHDEPEPSSDAEKKDDEGVSKASGVDDQERPKSTTPNINTARPSINTASANPKTGSLHIIIKTGSV